MKSMKSFRSPDGTHWGVEVQNPGASRAIIVFRHPDGETSRKDRYSWFDWHGPEASDVVANIEAQKIVAALDLVTIENLFKRSMLIGSGYGPGVIAA